jgi:hypothetical protein
MMNHETIDRAKAVVDRLTILAQQYSWQSAAMTGSDAVRVAPVLAQMAANQLLRANIVATALVCEGYNAESVDPPKERIPVGRDTREMLQLDRQAVIETIRLCEGVLLDLPEEEDARCLVQQLFGKFCREEQEHLVLLDTLLNQSGTSEEEPQGSSPPKSP